MIKIENIIETVKNYQGESVTIMEVCGTHTSTIAKSGIKSLLSERIKLVSGPGCPVCVTVSSYIDRLCQLAMEEGTTVVTFGDMIKVKGSLHSLSDISSLGGSVKIVYSPMEVIQLAQDDKNHIFVFAAVGFETTTPVYALLLQQALEMKLTNIRLLTSLKIMPPAIEWICKQNIKINGFIAPGHVCTLTGSDMLIPLADEYKLPFVVAGFDTEQVLSAIYLLLQYKNTNKVINLYQSCVSPVPNHKAQELVETFFVVKEASWRGIGLIEDSGLYLREEYACFDCASLEALEDVGFNRACRCSDVITGRRIPPECELYGSVCTPENPQGACMVSEEGSCHSYYSLMV